MKRILPLIIVIATAMTITLVQSCKQGGSTGKLLKFNLEKGKGYDYEMIMDMDQKMAGQDSRIIVTSAYDITVTEDDGKIKSLKCSYKRFKMSMKMMGFEIELDTDKPSPAMTEEEIKTDLAKMMNQVFAGIVGKSFTMKVDEEGKVLEVKGFQEMIQSIVDSSAMGEEFKVQMNASLKDQFNEQTVKDQFAQVFTVFPNKEIKVGDSWEKVYLTGGRTAAKNTTTYIIEKIEGDHVTLTTKTKIEPSGENGMEIKGNQTGTMIVDSKTGLIIDGEFDLNMNTKVQGMEIETTGKGKTKGKAL